MESETTSLTFEGDTPAETIARSQRCYVGLLVGTFLRALGDRDLAIILTRRCLAELGPGAQDDPPLPIRLHQLACERVTAALAERRERRATAPADPLFEEPACRQFVPRIDQAIAQLEPMHRELLLRYHFLGQSLPIISDYLGLSSASVADELNRAVEALRRLLHTRQTPLTGPVLCFLLAEYGRGSSLEPLIDAALIAAPKPSNSALGGVVVKAAAAIILLLTGAALLNMVWRY